MLEKYRKFITRVLPQLSKLIIYHNEVTKIALGATFCIVFLASCNLIFKLLVLHKIYWDNPITYLHYWLTPSIRNDYHTKLQLSLLGGGLTTLFTALLFIKEKIPNIYGKARFATPSEIRKAGLYNNKGLKLGKAYGHELCLAGYEHIILFAPTGTGKSLSFCVPNLFSWDESCIVSDIKLSLFEMTSTHRKNKGHEVYLWNPASPEGKTHCYNPLDIISNNPQTRIDDIQKIAAIFIPDNPKSEPIWQVQSRFLFVALVLYILDTPGHPKTIGEVVRLVKSQPDFSKFVRETISTCDNLDPLCKHNLMKFGELHEKTRLSILATFESYFELFDNPLIDAATSKSDFDIRNLRKNKMTIYIGITNDNIVRLSALLSVFYQQTADVLTRKLPQKDESHGVLFLMDEFSSLRRMESFHKNIGLFREYRLRIAIIIQELSQLYDTYGRDGAKVFLNAKARIAFTQNDLETCEYLEKLLGNRTIKIKNISRRSGASTDRTNSDHYHSKPLLGTQEIRLLSESKSIIIIQGIKPIYAKKINSKSHNLKKPRPCS